MSTAPNDTAYRPEGLSAVLDAFDEEIRRAHGIDAALAGMEDVQPERKDGVRALMEEHLRALATLARLFIELYPHNPRPGPVGLYNAVVPIVGTVGSPEMEARFRQAVLAAGGRVVKEGRARKVRKPHQRARQPRHKAS